MFNHANALLNYLYPPVLSRRYKQQTWQLYAPSCFPPPGGEHIVLPQRGREEQASAADKFGNPRGTQRLDESGVEGRHRRSLDGFAGRVIPNQPVPDSQSWAEDTGMSDNNLEILAGNPLQEKCGIMQKVIMWRCLSWQFFTTPKTSATWAG